MKIKTSELNGAALDWAVAIAVEAWTFAHSYFPTMTHDPTFSGVEARNYPRGEFASLIPTCVLVPNNPFRQDPQPFCPSTDWGHGGPLIERFSVTIGKRTDCPPGPKQWDAFIDTKFCDTANYANFGHAPLIAACRAIVAAKLGDEVDVPEELL